MLDLKTYIEILEADLRLSGNDLLVFDEAQAGYLTKIVGRTQLNDH